LINPEDDVAFSGGEGPNVGIEEKAGEDCGGVSVDINSDELTLGKGKRDGSAEVEIG
jgi:hypothetical protein